jgi:hypothetical protein
VRHHASTRGSILYVSKRNGRGGCLFEMLKGVLAPQHTVLVPQHTVLVPQHTGLVPQHTVLAPPHTVLAPQRTVLVPQHTVLPSSRQLKAHALLDEDVPHLAADAQPPHSSNMLRRTT